MNTILDRYAFTQDDFFRDEVKNIVLPEMVQTDWRGITANELQQMVDIHRFSAAFTSTDSFDADTFRETHRKALNDPKQILIANYPRPEIGQVGGGHFSPIVAFDVDSDCILVMETSRYKYSPVWINLSLFVDAMSRTDDAGMPRGFLIIKEKTDSK